MKLLLTSLGVSNPSIRQALAGLLDRPFSEARAVFIPTAAHAVRSDKWWLIQDLHNLVELGWKELEILELTATDSLPPEQGLGVLEAADAIVVGGGIGFYLSHWLQRAGLFDRLPGLLEHKLYVGISAGSMVVGPALHRDRQEHDRTGRFHDDEYDETGPPEASSDRALGLVDFHVRPHLGSDFFPNITLPRMQRAAEALGAPLYAIDDQSAIVVADGEVRVVSEGAWKRFP